MPKAQSISGDTTLDFAVIGGGLVGLAIAYGLRKLGVGVAVFDAGDHAPGASRGNFALVWGQGKGVGASTYARWTQTSLGLWTDFAEELENAAGLPLHYRNRGGFHFSFDQMAFERRQALLAGQVSELGDDAYPFEMLSNEELKRIFPALGPTVAGASFCSRDGDVNSLGLYRALIVALRKLGGLYLPGNPVAELKGNGDGFSIRAGAMRYKAGRVVVAAGLETGVIGKAVGLDIPVRPQTGQIIVTEKAAPFLPYPVSTIRQTNEGGVMLGDSLEEKGRDDATTAGILSFTASRAVAAFPLIARLAVVRSWAALRVMTPDGLPIYRRSPARPNAFACVCHSGVTLAAAHTQELARQIVAGSLSGLAASFDSARFDVQAA